MVCRNCNPPGPGNISYLSKTNDWPSHCALNPHWDATHAGTLALGSQLKSPSHEACDAADNHRPTNVVAAGMQFVLSDRTCTRIVTMHM